MRLSKNGLIEYMGQDVIDLFLDEVIKQCVNFGICEKGRPQCYLHTVKRHGQQAGKKILDRIGVKKGYCCF